MKSALAWFLCVLMASNCSYIATKRVPANYQAQSLFDCTDSLTFAFSDMALTTLTGALAIGLLSSGRDGERTQQAAGFSVLALALGIGSSAIYGTYQVNRCRSTRRDLESDPESSPVDFDKTPEGELGGKCLPGGACADELVCDPMGTCVPEPDPFENSEGE